MNHEYATKDVVIIYPKLDQSTGKQDLPLQALALAGPLIKAGFEVKILDERVEEDIIGALSCLKSPPVCFGISAMFSHQPKSGLKIAEWIRDNFAGIPIVWGGWFPTILPMLAIYDSRVDIVVKGKAEITFTELVTALHKKQKLDGIAGLVYEEAGEIIETPDRSLEDPNEFPYKPYHLLNLEKYRFSDGDINFNSSYGCPFRCKFCSINTTLKKQWNKGLLPERVLDEIEDIIKNYGIQIKHISFQEDNFFNNKDRAKKILQLFVDRGLNITWQANMRIDQFLRFDSELLKLIKISGCTELGAGAESANQAMLDFISKDLKVEQIENAVEIARDYDINLRLNFISGLPGETAGGFRETLEKIRDFYAINPKMNKASIFQYFPIPGTPLYNMELEKGLINTPANYEEWANIAAESIVLTPLASSNKIARYTNKKFKIMSFYFSAAYHTKSHYKNKIMQLLKKIFQTTSRIRFEKSVWLFPIEWYLAKLIKK